MKYVYAMSHMLICVRCGMHAVTEYYSDGTIEERLSPMGKVNMDLVLAIGPCQHLNKRLAEAPE